MADKLEEALQPCTCKKLLHGFMHEVGCPRLRASLAMLCLIYLDAYADGRHNDTVDACARYGREAGRRVVRHRIVHAGYWFEEGQ